MEYYHKPHESNKPHEPTELLPKEPEQPLLSPPHEPKRPALNIGVIEQDRAEKLLSQMKSTFSPTNRTDVYGCGISLGWTSTFYLSPLFVTNLLIGFTATVLAAINGTFVFRRFMHPQNQLLKKVFSSTRKMKCDLVLDDDYERLNQVNYFDDRFRIKYK